MSKNRVLIFVFLICMTLILNVSCQQINQSFFSASTPSNILVSAAASLQDSLEEIQKIYQQIQPNLVINYNFGASGTLQQQIENGAPADIFFSAANKQMEALKAKKLIIPESRKNLLKNSLVLIVPKDSTISLTDFQNLTANHLQKIAVGEPKSVPAGQYAEQVFQRLRILEKIQAKFVLGNNVRHVLAAVESGNVDAGVVYATDAQLSNQIKVVTIAPETLHDPIIYPIAILNSSKNVKSAQDYIQFLAGEQAGVIFKKYGFNLIN